jgi:hypothetical protein
MTAQQEYVTIGGDRIQVGDKIEFQCRIGRRWHTSRSIVYGFYDNGVLISCNGFRKTFRLRWGEIRKKIY